MVNYTEILPYLKKIYFLAKKIPLSIYDFPFCLFEDKFFTNNRIFFYTPEARYKYSKTQVGYGVSHRVDKIKKGSKVIYQDKYRLKTDFCLKCRYFEKCPGITKPYFKKYQDKEIRELFSLNIK